MLATLTATHVAQVSEDLCETCDGTLVGIDTDGSMTGVVGIPHPCSCTVGVLGKSSVCACYLDGWPLNGGFTGWIPPVVGDLEDAGTYYEQCPKHMPALSADRITARPPLVSSLPPVAPSIDRSRCPGCQGRFPSWGRLWVNDEFTVLTHDGTALCPTDPSYGVNIPFVTVSYV